jgi:predicted dehydrogenase
MKQDRRDFLRTSAAGSLASFSVAATAYAAGNDLLKVGLIGCGGRGSMAAMQALRADENVKLWAMADAFEDRLTGSLAGMQRKQDIAPKLDVPPERQFVGFDAYKNVIECCDVVLLCTPPGFRPLHLKAAIDAGKHVFAEKPVAVDAPGVRSVLATCAEAKRKNLAVVSGLCLRYDYGFQETVKRIHDGAIGDVHTLYANDYRGTIWVNPRRPEWSDMTYQMRNWYYFTWLSGDFNVEQHVHFLDVCSWVKGNQYPVKAVGMGGRAQRTAPEYGQIFDHFSIVYEYADGSRMLSNCRQQADCSTNLSAGAVGSRGVAEFREKKRGLTIKNADGLWAYEGREADMYQTEHDELFRSIRTGQPINNGEYMSHSTLLAIMGRMSAYTGQTITWDMALNSQEDLSLPKYDWDVPLPSPAPARPGFTKFT